MPVVIVSHSMENINTPRRSRKRPSESGRFDSCQENNAEPSALVVSHDFVAERVREATSGGLAAPPDPGQHGRDTPVNQKLNSSQPAQGWQRRLKLGIRFSTLAARKEEGNVAFKSEEYEKASTCIQRHSQLTLRISSPTPNSTTTEPQFVSSWGRLNEAIQDCTQAIELELIVRQAISRRGHSYMETECFERSHPRLRDPLQAEPDS
ncbi:DNAJC7 [Branchiostoma lanceolatum]|uniref:DNAJC7 protein n=1 Tax=Branchiostoma lanceolatum TaxID=7740 RepID=A0A8J9ZIF2_BRALA|nr:DNAJC7 [Branchiostoma lanceolatum]